MSTASTASCGGRVLITGFFGVFFGMGVFFTGMLVQEVWQATKTRFWTKLECRVLETDLRTDGEDSGPYSLQVRYSYNAGGRTYESTQLALKEEDGWTDDYQKVQRMMLAYPVDGLGTCWVSPENPSDSVLVHGSAWMILFLPLPLIFVLVGGVGIYAAWFGKSGGTEEEEEEEPLSDQSKGRLGGLAFCAFFAFIGLAALVGFFGPPVVGLLLSLTWEPTTCVIDRSTLLTTRSDDGYTYQIDILYRYDVDGDEYRSNNYNFLSFSSSGKSSKHRVLHRYPIGSEHTCYVNPGDPTEAVLHRGLSLGYLLALIPLVFLAAGVAGMVAMLRKNGAKHRGSRESRGQRQRQPLVLKSRGSPLSRLFVLLVFAAFWNIVVGIFVSQVVRDFSAGRGSWFMVLFMIPFVLVGLALIGGVLYSLLALFNPRPQVRLTPGCVALGETADLQWRLRGRASRLTTFRVTLEGREEATYRVGTSSRTDRHVFHQQVLAETEDPHQMARGKLPLAIPAHVMHTFTAPNNKIVWMLKVHGEIDKWPDVKEEFELEVIAP